MNEHRHLCLVVFGAVTIFVALFLLVIGRVLGG